MPRSSAVRNGTGASSARPGFTTVLHRSPPLRYPHCSMSRTTRRTATARCTAKLADELVYERTETIGGSPMALSAPAANTRHTFCRVCHASCPMEVDVVDNRVIAVRGVARRSAVRGLHLHQGTPAARPDGRPEPPARSAAAATRRHVRTGDERRGARRDRRAPPTDHRHPRTPSGRLVHGHRRLPELRRRARRPRLPPGDRVGVVLHVGHHRPAGQGPRCVPARGVGGRLPELHRLRRPHGDRVQPDGLLVRPDRRAAGHEPVRRHAAPQGRGHEAHRDRPEAHRAGVVRRHPPAGPPGRGPDAAGRR